jgi:hypothetical protein
VTVETPRDAGVGECERCHRKDVQRLRYEREVPSTPGSHAEGSTLVLVEPLCDDCYRKAIDNRKR